MYYLDFHSVSRYQIRNCDIIILLVKQRELYGVVHHKGKAFQIENTQFLLVFI